MYRNMNRVSGGYRIADIPFVGVLAQDCAEAGESGDGFLANEAANPAHAGKRLRARFYEIPADGNFYTWADGRLSFTDASDGLHIARYLFDVDAVEQSGFGQIDMYVGPVVIDCVPGVASATGVDALIQQAVLISCTPGQASATGLAADVFQAQVIDCTPGAAIASGIQAELVQGSVINCSVGGAVASGVGAAIIEGVVINCAVGVALARGIEAEIDAVSDADKIDLILDILSNRQELDPISGLFTLYADDGVTPYKTAYAWEDTAGTIPYRGRGLKRLDAMQ